MIKDNQKNELLLDIIDKNSDCEYGRNYHFDYYRTVDGYRFNVPLTDFRDVRPLVELTTRVGESSIFTEDKLIAFALSSKVNEEINYLPCTKQHIAPYVREFRKILKDGRGDKVVLCSSIPHNIIYSDQAKLNTITGIILDRTRSKLKKKRITSPEALLFSGEYADMVYYRTLFAVRSNKVDTIIAPSCWNVMEMIDCIMARHEELIHDLQTGSVTFDAEIPEKLKAGIRAAFKPSLKRAGLLDSIFASGDMKNLLVRIWPGLRKIIAAGTGTFEIYRDNLKKYIGEAVHSNGFFASAEAIMGVAVPGSDIYKMYEKNAFLEFLPVSCNTAGDESRTVLSDEVEVGGKYLIYVTNYSGLYRYCTGDIVEIMDVKDGIPYFRYEGRAGERFSEQEIYHAVRTAAEEQEINVSDFCYEEDAGGSLTLYLETREPEKIDHDAFAGALPEELNASNIKIIPFGTQYACKHQRGESEDMASDHLKPVRYLSADEAEDFFSASEAISSSSSSR